MERYELSKTFRLRFVVGFPDGKTGLPAFSVEPIPFRIPGEIHPAGRSDRAKASKSIDPFAMVLKAIAWAEELDRNSNLKRADIARREGISRARVTQLLQLASRGRAFWGDLRASGRGFSIRDLLGIVQHEKGSSL